MSIGLYMDVHIPLAITEGRRRRGIDVLTAQQDGADRLEDELLLQRATRLDRALFSQDEDLWSFWVYCGSSEKEMHRVRLSPQDLLRHLAGVQVVIDHELEVGVPTLIGTLAGWLRQRPFSQREILGHLRDASENPAAPAALNHTAATTRTTVGQSLTLPPNPHETRMDQNMTK